MPRQNREEVKALSLTRTRLFRELLLYAGLLASMAAITLTVIAWLAGQSLQSQIDAGLEAEAHAWARMNSQIMPSGVSNSDDSEAGAGLFDPEDAGPRFYTFTDSQGLLPAGSMPALSHDQILASQTHPITVPAGPEFANKPGVDDDIQELRVISQPLGDGRVLIISQALNEANELVDGIILSATIGVGLIVLFGFLGAFGAGKRVTRHFEGVARTADELARGDFKYRLPTRNPGDEFDVIADVLNSMLSRIETLVNQVRDVSQNVAHDLRGPLTRVKNQLENIASKESRDDINEVIGELDAVLATFNSILQISGLESAGATIAMAPVDIAQIAAQIVEMYAAPAEDCHMRIEQNLQTPLPMIANRELLGKAISNLLDNALKHCPAGTRIQVGAEKQNDIVTIYIADDGVGIPEEFRGKALERFFRCDSARSTPGNGLGLAMVKAIAEAHRGNVVLADNHPGLRAEIRLPVTS